MFRRIKRELAFVGDNIPVIALGAFICCIGGIFLWVGGDAGWYYAYSLGRGRIVPLGMLFVVWLLTYALCGFVLALSCLSDRACCGGRLCGMRAAFVGGVGYFMMLMWYVLLFCTRLAFFGIFVLILSIILIGAALIIMKNTFVVLTAAGIIIEIIQISFLIFSISLYLLN